MNFFKFFIVLLISVFSLNVLAGSGIKDKHPIDIWLDANMSKDPSTFGMRKTTNQAQQKWEIEMNNVYKRFMLKLNRNQQIALRKSQRSWLKFREADGNAISEIVSVQDGTIHQLSGTSYGMELVRERTLKLISYESQLEI